MEYKEHLILLSRSELAKKIDRLPYNNKSKWQKLTFESTKVKVKSHPMQSFTKVAYFRKYLRRY